jgi:hypothetical protein
VLVTSASAAFRSCVFVNNSAIGSLEAGGSSVYVDAGSVAFSSVLPANIFSANAPYDCGGGSITGACTVPLAATKLVVATASLSSVPAYHRERMSAAKCVDGIVNNIIGGGATFAIL